MVYNSYIPYRFLIYDGTVVFWGNFSSVLLESGLISSQEMVYAREHRQTERCESPALKNKASRRPLDPIFTFFHRWN